MRTNKIPRQIPPQPWYMHDVFFVLVGGILPFGAVFIELFFILTSIWLQQFYYIFGFSLSSSSSSSWPSQRSLSCCATSNCARKITDGGGARS